MVGGCLALTVWQHCCVLVFGHLNPVKIFKQQGLDNELV